MNEQKYWSVRQLADTIGLTDARIRQLIGEEHIAAAKVAQTWVILDHEARRFLSSRGIEVERAVLESEAD